MAVRDVIFIAVILMIFAVGFISFHYAYGVAEQKLLLNPTYNSSSNAVTALKGSEKVMARMDYVIFGLFIGLILAMIITAWIVGGHPIFMFIYFLVSVVGVVIATIISNVWESITIGTVLASSLTAFPLTDYIMLKLPFLISVITFVGMVVMFSKPQEGGIHP
jgi:hypothetical protein